MKDLLDIKTRFDMEGVSSHDVVLVEFHGVLKTLRCPRSRRLRIFLNSNVRTGRHLVSTPVSLQSI